MKNTPKIEFYFYNKFDETFLGRATFCYIPQKAILGYYSKLWKKWKLFLASENKIDKHWVRMLIRIIK